jgi:hypothetical protein
MARRSDWNRNQPRRSEGRSVTVAAFASVWDDQAGAAVAVVRDERDPVTGALRAGSSHAVLLRLVGDGVIASGPQAFIHYQHGVLAEPLAGLQSQRGPEVADDAIRCHVRSTEEQGELSRCQVRPPVCGDRRARSSSGRLHGRPLRTGYASSRRNAGVGLPNCRGLSPLNGAVQEGSDAVIAPATA